MITLKTLLATWLINYTYAHRPLYRAMAALCESRQFYGTNPLRGLVDGTLSLLVGVAMLVLIPLSLVLHPLSLVIGIWTRPGEYGQVKGLVRAGRINWANGTVIEVSDQ